MTPKEKAKELLTKFDDQNYFSIEDALANSKYNALICVNEIIDLQLELAHDDNVNNIADFYKEVKEELETF